MTRVLTNADVRVLDGTGARAEAIAWREGRILAVGSERDVLRVAGDDATLEDAGGASVLPGFIDPHHHPAIVALYGGTLRLVPPKVTDIASLQRAIRDAARSTPAGTFIVATDWDELHLTERRPPTRAELDDAAPEHPVFALHYTCHRAVANARALELAGIGRDTPDPSGGAIGRAADGSPNGLLVERGMSPVESRARRALLARDAEGFLGRLGAHHHALAAEGITRLADATVPRDLFPIYREAAARGLLVVPTILMPVSTKGYLEAPWDLVEDVGVDLGTPGDVLQLGPIKLVFDGAPGCAMCLGWLQTAGTLLSALALAVEQGNLDPLQAAMSVAPRISGREIRTGIQIFHREEARDVVAKAVARGFSLATHAIGNEAVAIALDAYEAAGPALARAGRPRLEHATFLDRELVQRIADSGAAVITQPNFMALPAYDGAGSIPRVRNAPLRWLMDAKVLVAGSSDFPVAGFSPLAGIAAAVSRRTRSGRVYEADQCISVDEALLLYTRNAADALGHLSQCGTLETGKRADLVVIDGALTDEASIRRARVVRTVIGGETVFDRASRDA